MKILLVTMEYPPFHGGVGNYYSHFAQELTALGFEVKVLTQKNFSESRITNHESRITYSIFFYKFFCSSVNQR